MKKFLLAALMLFPVIAFAVTVAELNNVLNFPLFAADGKTWDYPAFRARVNRAMKLTGNNGRFAAKVRLQVAGAPAHEIVVYTAGKKPQISTISVIFANKGDTNGNYNSQIKDAKRNISTSLSRIMGKPKRSTLRTGMIRAKADLWQTPFAQFYLEVDKKEFVILHIMPLKPNSTANSTEDKDYSTNVRRNNFGDVFIPNVPMVDQGAKGYCVPATMERIFLYYGIRMDMHHLAEIGNSSKDDGTDTNRIIKDITTIRRRAGLKYTRIGTLSVKGVSRYIDKGYPVMWVMYSTSDLKRVYQYSVANRSKAASPDQWRRSLKKITIPYKEEGPHVCLIVGYNLKTDEIAVTNSWGAAHIVPIWIPAKAAYKISRETMVFTP